MPDQPQHPNSSRISSMLSDLAVQRGHNQTANPNRSTPPPTRPMPVPSNLPTSQPGSRPAPLARPVTPPPTPRPQPPLRPNATIPESVRSITAPTPDELPGATPLVRPPAPPTPPAIPPQAPAPVAPKPTIAPQEPGYTSELRTMSADIGRISTGQPTTGVKPAPALVTPAGRPTPPIPGAPVPPVPVISIPEPTHTGGLARKVLYGVVFLGIIWIIYIVISFVFPGEKGLVVSPSPSASAAATLAPSVKSLTSYFRQTGNALTLKADGTAITDFINALATAQPTSQQALRIPLAGPFTTSMVQFLKALDIADPALTDLTAALGTDWAVVAYGQKEQFGVDGTVANNATTKPRLVLVSEVTDASKANQVMTQWETQGFASHSGEVFRYDVHMDTAHQFASGTYRQIPIRYHNFPYADSSLDWAILTASNNKSYLVMSASRESMFFSIDQLMQ